MIHSTLRVKLYSFFASSFIVVKFDQDEGEEEENEKNMVIGYNVATEMFILPIHYLPGNTVTKVIY